MPRLAWFSPMPPVRTGVATYSADAVAGLAAAHLIDVYVDEPPRAAEPGDAPGRYGIRSAHDFIWEHRQRPYDLTVFQLGNSSFHDYIWPYVFRYPGLTVLHDAHLHHARAASLLRTKRADDYRSEFAANHPDTSPDLAELAVAGFDSHLYYRWPMTRLVVDFSRVTAVHSVLVADELRVQSPSAVVETIRMAHGELLDDVAVGAARDRLRPALGYAADHVVFGVFGGLSPEKRVPQVLDAFEALLPYAPHARLLLAGGTVEHYDIQADVEARGLESTVTLTGYLDDERDLSAHLAACDVSLNLRWPTARETSGPWLRALAAGRATITLDLAHLADVPSLDPRSWTVAHATAAAHPLEDPVMVSIDILDEAHSLRLALRRLATDADLRDRLGAAGRAHWLRHHAHDRMIEDYQHAIERAINQPSGTTGDAALPRHVRESAVSQVDALLEPFGMPALWSKI